MIETTENFDYNVTPTTTETTCGFTFNNGLTIIWYRNPQPLLKNLGAICTSKSTYWDVTERWEEIGELEGIPFGQGRDHDST